MTFTLQSHIFSKLSSHMAHGHKVSLLLRDKWHVTSYISFSEKKNFIELTLSRGHLVMSDDGDLETCKLAVLETRVHCRRMIHSEWQREDWFINWWGRIYGAVCQESGIKWVVYEIRDGFSVLMRWRQLDPVRITLGRMKHLVSVRQSLSRKKVLH